MSTEDYEALLAPEREQVNSANGDDDPANYMTVEEAATALGLTERQTHRYADKIRTRLLGRRHMYHRDDVAQLAKERSENRLLPLPEKEQSGVEAEIQEAYELLQKAAEQRTADKAEIKRLSDDLDAALRDIARLQTDNNRLQNEIKREISRGLLRHGMDNLRKVL